jgi:hypothetical protein
MSIYKKLHTIQSRIIGLGKDKKSHNYDYVTGAKLLENIKPIMNELGLILKQEVIEATNERMDYQVYDKYTKEWKPKSEIFTSLKMRFTWVDVETGEKDENLFSANGQNDWEKGLGSALTYGERYFLLKFFHIATDEDDIDNPERKPEPKAIEPLSNERVMKAIENKAQQMVLDGNGTKWLLTDAQIRVINESL